MASFVNIEFVFCEEIFGLKIDTFTQIFASLF